MRAGEAATNKLNGLIPMPMDNIHSFDLFPKTRTGIYLVLLILLVKQEFFELAWAQFGQAGLLPGPVQIPSNSNYWLKGRV
jgi:hypothetical protein